MDKSLFIGLRFRNSFTSRVSQLYSNSHGNYQGTARPARRGEKVKWTDKMRSLSCWWAVLNCKPAALPHQTARRPVTKAPPPTPLKTRHAESSYTDAQHWILSAHARACNDQLHCCAFSLPLLWRTWWKSSNKCYSSRLSLWDVTVMFMSNSHHFKQHIFSFF